MISSLRDGARSGITKFLLIGFMGLAVMGLVFTDMTGSFRDGIGRDNVARVGDTEIDTIQLRSGLQQAEQQTGMISIPTEMRLHLAYQVLDNQIRRRLYIMEAQELGLIISDRLAANQIRDQLRPLIDAGLTAEEALAQNLRSTGMSEQQFLQAFKQDLALRQMVRTISSGTYAPDAMLDAAYRYQNQQRSADIIRLNFVDFESRLSDPDEETLEAFYQNNLAHYMTDEYREISYAIFDRQNIETTLDTSDETLHRYYNRNIDDYTLADRRIVDQAVFQSAEMAQDVIAESQTPEDLIDAVQSRPSSAYVLLQDEAITQDDIAGDVVQAAFDTPLGQITGPIETSLGWIVMAVKSEEEKTVQDFEDVRDTVQRDYIRNETENRLYDTANQIDEMLASARPLNEIAAAYGLRVYQTPLMTVEGQTQDGRSAEILQRGFAEELLGEAFALDHDEPPLLLEADNGVFVAYAITNIREPRPISLDDIRTDVTNDWRREEAFKEMIALTAEIQEKANSGTSLSDLADEYDLQLEQQAPLMAETALAEDAVIDRAVAETLFNLRKTGDIRQASTEDGIILVQLTEIIFPTDAPDENTRNEYRSAIQERIQTDLMIQYEAALRDNYNVRINDRAVERLIRPVNANNF